MYYAISSITYCFPFDTTRSAMNRHGGHVYGNPDQYGVLAPWIGKQMTEAEADDLLCQLIRKHPFMKDAMYLRIMVTWHAADRDLSGIYQSLSFSNPDAGSERKQYVPSPIQWR